MVKIRQGLRIVPNGARPVPVSKGAAYAVGDVKAIVAASTTLKPACMQKPGMSELILHFKPGMSELILHFKRAFFLLTIRPD